VHDVIQYWTTVQLAECPNLSSKMAGAIVRKQLDATNFPARSFNGQ